MKNKHNEQIEQRTNKGNYLFVVNYVDKPRLKDIESMKTLSIHRAYERARYLVKLRDEVLYSQIVAYRYSSVLECYQFVTLKNFYEVDSFNTIDFDAFLVSLIMED